MTFDFRMIALIAVIFLSACTNDIPVKDNTVLFGYDFSQDAKTPTEKLRSKYTPFTLTTDMSALSGNQKKMIKLLVEAATYMDDLFWYEWRCSL